MNNTSADKFAEYPYHSCEIRPNNDEFGRGKGQWRADYQEGSGILDNEDGAGFAKGYTNDSSFCPAHYHPYNY